MPDPPQQKRYEKAISTDNEKGAPVAIRGYKNPREEMRAVAEELREAEKNGCPYEEMELLFRTNLGCRTAVEELMEAQIPFQMRDTLPDLYDHWIAKDLLTYLNLAMGSRKRGEFLKIANRPNRYLSRDPLRRRLFRSMHFWNITKKKTGCASGSANWSRISRH